MQLAPCEGTPHTGETSLTREDLDGIKEILTNEDVTKPQVQFAINALRKGTFTSEFDTNAISEAESALNGKGTRGQTLGRAVDLLITVIDRVFPRVAGGGKRRIKYCMPSGLYGGFTTIPLWF